MKICGRNGKMLAARSNKKSIYKRALKMAMPLDEESPIQAVCGKAAARTVLCGGRALNARPYRYRCRLLRREWSLMALNGQNDAHSDAGFRGAERPLRGSAKIDANDPTETWAARDFRIACSSLR
jgi:hypothetical protein